MSDNFAELFEQSLANTKMYSGAIVAAEVVSINSDYVIVNAGLKSEGKIALSQFKNEAGELEVAVGDKVQVALDSIENGRGETRFSREKAKRAETWGLLSTAFEEKTTINGLVTGKVKGGFTVDVCGIRAFLPGSLVDVRPVRDTGILEGQDLEFKIIKLDQKRNNVVVSRRSVVESESSAERDALMDTLAEGQEVKGVVKNLTDYGAFVDLGGIDGLLHITDMAWKRVKHPNEVVNVGEEILVKILKFDKDRSRVSLGLKQLGDDPWVDITNRYPESTRLTGKVTNVTDYGCFVEIESGVEGLVHVSEMDWTNKNIHPSKVVQLGDEVEVLVLDIDEERRRISLGIKQCKSNPWDDFAQKHAKGEKLTGSIKSITDFGIFIGLDGGIDGLIHLSDIAWEEEGDVVVRNYKKGDEIEAVILAMDPERERISLGIKQLTGDDFTNYTSEHAKGTLVTGKITKMDEKSAEVELTEGVLAQLAVSDMDEGLKIGDEIEAKIINVDKKSRVISISIKAREVHEQKQAIKDLKRSSSEVTNQTLGDLLKEKMGSNKKDADT